MSRGFPARFSSPCGSNFERGFDRVRMMVPTLVYAINSSLPPAKVPDSRTLDIPLCSVSPYAP